MTKKSSKKTKKPIKSQRSLLLKKMKKYATAKNAYRSLILTGTLGLIGASIYRKKANAKAEAAGLVNKLHTIKKEIEDCYRGLSEIKKEHDVTLEKYNKVLQERMMINQKKAKQFSDMLESIKKKQGGGNRRIRGGAQYWGNPFIGGSHRLGGRVVRQGGVHRGGAASLLTYPEYSLDHYIKKLDKCKKLREDSIKEFVDKMSNIENKIREAEKLADEYKFKIMDIVRNQLR
jgi:hypothetical protein